MQKRKKEEEGKEKQKKPRGIILGSSLTYITDRSFDGAEGKYKELSWNINATTFLSRRLRTGINTIQIFTSAPSEIKEKYFLIGGIGQYEPFLSKKHFFMLEAGLMYGNYCTCEAGDPTKRDGLYYVDLGGSFEMQLSKKLYLDIGFNVYNILNDVKGKYAYTQYILGLNYIIGKR